MEEYSINYIDDIKIHDWTQKTCPYLQFFTDFVHVDTPEWMLLEQDDDGEKLTNFSQR